MKNNYKIFGFFSVLILGNIYFDIETRNKHKKLMEQYNKYPNTKK